MILALVAAGCGASTPSETPMPVATTADEFADAWCSSLQAMARAIGNPDTAADSKLSAALDVAIERGDAASVEQIAAQMKAELETGRRFAAVAAGWQPGEAAMVPVDRLILAFEECSRRRGLSRPGPWNGSEPVAGGRRARRSDGARRHAGRFRGEIATLGLEPSDIGPGTFRR
jgi:hypothetical protein